MNLKQNPFFLTDDDINWVNNTLNAMTLDEKIGQLFCPIGFSDDENFLKAMATQKHVGGFLFRAGEGKKLQQAHRVLQENAKIPMFLCANVETGGDGIANEGTAYGEQLQVAATAKNENAYTLGAIAAKEGAAVGLNLALGPIVDIDYNYRNPITNVRTFGSDKNVVRDMALQTIKGLQENGLGAMVKHFPGDGVDDRDQHLLTSVNTMEQEEWLNSYGEVYKAAFENGVLSVMAGHIALPAFQTDAMPATLSKELLQDLLRQKLNFNGLIMTDATPMVGFCCAMQRERAVPYSIECGCDMFLFNKDIDEDYQYMKKGIESGILSEERFNEALTRILATKAAMGLHKKDKKDIVPHEKALEILGCESHINAAKACANEAITLVKNKDNVLPLCPQKHKRILLEIVGGFESDGRVCEKMKALLEENGFEITVYEPENFQTLDNNIKRFKAKYDAVLYVGNVETISNKTVSRINWHTFFGNGNNVPWFAKELPTLFVAVGNPYLMQDVPMINTFVNAYFNSDIVLTALVEKLLGKSEFVGKTPVDPFCGRKELM